MPEHFAEVELYEDGGGAFVRFVCAGDDTNVCRQWCAEGCEEQCLASDIIPWPASQGAPTPVDGEAHRWQPHFRAGESTCRIVDWLDAVGWQDSGWVDDDEVGEREVTTADLRAGRHLIETEWTGDDYIWRYPAEPAVTDAGGTR